MREMRKIFISRLYFLFSFRHIGQRFRALSHMLLILHTIIILRTIIFGSNTNHTETAQPWRASQNICGGSLKKKFKHVGINITCTWKVLKSALRKSSASVKKTWKGSHVRGAVRGKDKSQVLSSSLYFQGAGWNPGDWFLRPFPGKSSNVPDKICSCGNLRITTRWDYIETSLFPSPHFILNGDGNLAFWLEMIKI